MSSQDIALKASSYFIKLKRHWKQLSFFLKFDRKNVFSFGFNWRLLCDKACASSGVERRRFLFYAAATARRRITSELFLSLDDFAAPKNLRNRRTELLVENVVNNHVDQAEK